MKRNSLLDQTVFFLVSFQSDKKRNQTKRNDRFWRKHDNKHKQTQKPAPDTFVYDCFILPLRKYASHTQNIDTTTLKAIFFLMYVCGCACEPVYACVCAIKRVRQKHIEKVKKKERSKKRIVSAGEKKFRAKRLFKRKKKLINMHHEDSESRDFAQKRTHAHTHTHTHSHMHKR